jgi:hypothetical protein
VHLHQSPWPSIQYPTESTQPCIIIPWLHLIHTVLPIIKFQLLLIGQTNLTMTPATTFSCSMISRAYHVLLLYASWILHSNSAINMSRSIIINSSMDLMYGLSVFSRKYLYSSLCLIRSSLLHDQ